ncbi:hypothetical protein BDN71DRAFT_1436771 [Pleurotus eryngii]|uniref:Uncharacterized protein n=1 Tax=Pleurotus eryngii TaxID=5323 RepID=A0A9P5ZHK6_PLEER|nr:hypothetical protein BDN71DRAFT_1436771 [Pleurotus eryngii]
MTESESKSKSSGDTLEASMLFLSGVSLAIELAKVYKPAADTLMMTDSMSEYYNLTDQTVSNYNQTWHEIHASEIPECPESNEGVTAESHANDTMIQGDLDDRPLNYLVLNLLKPPNMGESHFENKTMHQESSTKTFVAFQCPESTLTVTQQSSKLNFSIWKSNLKHQITKCLKLNLHIHLNAQDTTALIMPKRWKAMAHAHVCSHSISMNLNVPSTSQEPVLKNPKPWTAPRPTLSMKLELEDANGTLGIWSTGQPTDALFLLIKVP